MRRAVLTALTVALAGASALGYQVLYYNGAPARWPGATCRFYHDPSWSGFPSYVSELNAASATWNNVPGSDFAFVVGGSSPSADLRNTNNGNSDNYFDNLGASVFAVTYTSQNGSTVSDRDVAFSTSWSWSTGGGGGPDFRSVAIHEFGHVLGLGHESSLPARMQPFYDGSSLLHSLAFDDEEGCRFLYPEPPPPPPPPSNADLVADGVSFTPADASDGEDVVLRITMRNAGTDPTGAFAVTAYLSESAQVSSSDRYLRATAQASLAPGGVRDVSMLVQLPDTLESRGYRIGVILDAQGAVADRDRSNNTAVATGVIVGGGETVVVGPGHRVTGTMIPFGRETFMIDLAAGMRVNVRATVDGGSLEMSVTAEDGGSTLFQQRRYRRVKAKFEAPEDGRYVLRLINVNSTAEEYEVRVGARPLNLTGRITVVAANHVRLPGYLGATVDAKIRSRSDVRPTAEWLALTAPLDTNRRGTRVKLGRVPVLANGPLVLVLSRGDGPDGEASYKIRQRFPKKGPLIRR